MPLTILEDLYKVVSENLLNPVVNHTTTRGLIETICRCNANKAPIRFLMSCVLAKICNPKVDIRKPYTEIPGDDTYSGRYYDERYIEVFIHKYKLPCNLTTAYLTPAFRNIDRVLDTDLVLVGRPKDVYNAVLLVLEFVHRNIEPPQNVLMEIIRILLIIKSEDELRMKQLLSNLHTTDIHLLSSEDIVVLLSQHLSCKHSSRLPVLIVASAYQAVKDCIGEVNKKLKAHNAADSQTGSVGDIEIMLENDDKIITCYEMKDKRVTKTDIDVAIQKISTVQDMADNYIFITTDIIEPEVSEYAKSIYEKIGVEFAILDCIGFIKHFLHFFHRRRIAFLNIYQEMVLNEPNSSVSQPLKEAFLALRRSFEADRR